MRVKERDKDVRGRERRSRGRLRDLVGEAIFVCILGILMLSAIGGTW